MQVNENNSYYLIVNQGFYKYQKSLNIIPILKMRLRKNISNLLLIFNTYIINNGIKPFEYLTIGR